MALAAPESAPPKPAAPIFDSAARAALARAIFQQVQPCADRQAYLGEGADQVVLTVNVRLTSNGRLIRPPVVLSMSGDANLRAKYGAQLEAQVRRIFADCSPLRLPTELYDTPTGGWNNFTIMYKVN